jgi:predicted DCC family thiol-disulfide oxidoreductase YuxK
MTPKLAAACADAFHVVCADGRLLRAGRAALYVLAGLGWRRTAAVLSLPPLIWLVEVGYRVVADHRPFFSRLLFRG